MSSKRKPTKLRGPSRPIDPRNAPGYRPVKSGPDSFGMVLLGVSAAFVVLVILFVVLQNNNGATTNVAGTGQDTSGNTASQNLDANAAATATVVTLLNIVSGVPRTSIHEVRKLQEANDVTIIDVMPPNVFASSHVAGAKNIPQGQVLSRSAEIPKTGNVILYCQCPNDEESLYSAYTLIQSQGYTNVRVMQGPLALTLWKQAGYPVEGSGS